MLKSSSYSIANTRQQSNPSGSSEKTYIFHQNTTFPSTPIPMPYARHRSAWTHLQQPLRPRLVTTRHMLRHNFNVLVWDLLYLKRDPHSLRKRTIRIPVQDQICRVGVELRGPCSGTGCGARGNGAARELPRGGRGRRLPARSGVGGVLGFLGLFGSLEQVALDTVLLDAVAFFEGVLVRRDGGYG